MSAPADDLTVPRTVEDIEVLRYVVKLIERADARLAERAKHGDDGRGRR